MPGVYLSWPFCAQKCTYCNFASGVFPKQWEPLYAARLTQELTNTEWPWLPETVFLGGGTPSQMDPALLSQLLSAVPGRPWREATMEAAPGSFSPATIAAWQQAGINRVSLGVQSFIDAELRKTGRKHTAAIVSQDVANLRAAGIENINLDLIAGLAGQTPESWERSLDHIAQLAPPHVSVYMLEVDADSRLGLEILNNGGRYGARDIPTEDSITAMYERAAERLAALGIPRYEISNFARPGLESRHNLKYWQREDYLGFGADAHSCANGQRWQNVETAQQYVDSPHPRLSSTPANPAEERFFLGLRLTAGVAPTPDEWRLHRATLDGFLRDGLLEQIADRLRLTPRGILLSNEIFQEFLTP